MGSEGVARGTLVVGGVYVPPKAPVDETPDADEADADAEADANADADEDEAVALGVA